MASLSNKNNRAEIIKDNTDPAKGISLVIPRVFNNISWRRITQVFKSLGWGFVERVDTIPVQGGNFKRAFVHFMPGRWNTQNPSAMAALDALRNGQLVKIVYHEPWFWKVGISSSPKPTEALEKRRKAQSDLLKKLKKKPIPKPHSFVIVKTAEQLAKAVEVLRLKELEDGVVFEGGETLDERLAKGAMSSIDLTLEDTVKSKPTSSGESKKKNTKKNTNKTRKQNAGRRKTKKRKKRRKKRKKRKRNRVSRKRTHRGNRK